jgi:hypothetical protein
MIAAAPLPGTLRQEAGGIVGYFRRWERSAIAANRVGLTLPKGPRYNDRNSNLKGPF